MARGFGSMTRGYSLVELLVVLGVLAVLAQLAMPLAEVVRQRENERELRRALWEIRDAIDAFRAARLRAAPELAQQDPAAAYPSDLGALLGRDGQRFLRRIPRDPFAPAELPAERTWGLRSYASDAAKPQPGREVYDVYSLSPRRGLNGVPLGQW